jgi:hypothetical protein
MLIVAGRWGDMVVVEISGKAHSYRITNLRGLVIRTGQRAKQSTKQARAPKLQAPKINKRSQRLTR